MIGFVQATEGVKKLFNTIRVKDFEDNIMAMLQRLMNGDFTSKIAAISLFPHVYASFRVSS